MRTFLSYSTLALLLLWHAPAQASQQDQLFDLIDARLELMDEVAAYKWEKQLAIEDKSREEVVLDEAAEEALNANLDPVTSRLFFETQIDAAKEIQRYWFSQYEAGKEKPGKEKPGKENSGKEKSGKENSGKENSGKENSGKESPGKENPGARDLNTEVRPELLRLGNEILKSMAANPALDEGSSAQFAEQVNVVGLSPQTRDAMFARLLAVKHFPDALSRILQTGLLRVGTTGDYAPFSWKTGDQWQGIDIDMARNLAISLGVKLVLVQTSWPSLVADLDRGAFDIGMSGISINTDRAIHGYYSVPYHSGGKTPIARCEDQNQFNSLEAIDLPTVRVIVNPGGTNHRFAIDNIKQASITVFPDNRTVFDEIAEGRADVMVTDAIEVKLVSENDDRLCPTMPGQTFTQSQKAYFMQPDIRLKEFVNTWLSLQILDGSYQQIFDAAFNH